MFTIFAEKITETMIATWWEGLAPVMKILWGVTLTASLIFIIQSILTFVGADTGGDLDASVDSDIPGGDGTDLSNIDTGTNLLTFRNFVNFFLGFGWTAILLQGQVKSTGLLMVIAALAGICLVALVLWLFKWLNSMQQSGNIDLYKTAVGCQGHCYLAIPAERGGTGKVQISINNSVREYDAVTDGDAIPTGASIKVSEVLDGNTLLVEPLNSLII